VHPGQITAWKEQLLRGAADVFTDGRHTKPPVDVKTLHAKIGQLALENVFAKNGPALQRRAVFTLVLSEVKDLLSQATPWYIRWLRERRHDRPARHDHCRQRRRQLRHGLAERFEQLARRIRRRQHADDRDRSAGKRLHSLGPGGPGNSVLILHVTSMFEVPVAGS